MIQRGTDAADLSRLNDIVLPPEVSLWPTAPGWPLVGVGLAIVLFALVLHLVRRRRALRYRREALLELRGLRAAGRLDALPVLLKRVALEAHPRREVAALCGDEWARFLDRSGARGRFGAGLGELLSELTYGPARGGQAQERDERLGRLFEGAEQWIRAQGPAR